MAAGIANGIVNYRAALLDKADAAHRRSSVALKRALMSQSNRLKQFSLLGRQLISTLPGPTALKLLPTKRTRVGAASSDTLEGALALHATAMSNPVNALEIDPRITPSTMNSAGQAASKNEGFPMKRTLFVTSVIFLLSGRPRGPTRPSNQPSRF